MIDDKTREKILMLWRQGESKSSIKRKTNISLPTIRKVIKENDSSRNNSGKSNGLDLRFILNFSRNTPAAWYPGSFQHLEGGVAPWRYKKVLLKFLSPESVEEIDERLIAISGGRPEGRIFRARLSDFNDVEIIEVVA